MGAAVTETNCRCCSFLLTATLSAVFLWLALRTSDPSLSLQQFYLPALNKTLNQKHNTTLYFMLQLQNTNKDKGVYYDNVDLTFFHSQNKSHAIGNYSISRFRQGHGKTAKRVGQLESNYRKSGFSNRTEAFRVDLVTTVRFKIMLWKTKRHKIVVGANVEVNDQGTYRYQKKGIPFKKSNGLKLESTFGILLYACCTNILFF